MMLTAFGLLCVVSSATAQSYTLSGVDELPLAADLPDPFRMNNGARVVMRADWAKRRKEIVEILSRYEYGHMPPAPSGTNCEETESVVALDGAALRRRATVHTGPDLRVHMQVGCFVPRGKKGPFPVILAVEPVWLEPLTPVARRVVDRGYIFAGFERHDLDADSADRRDGVHPLYPDYDWASLAVWAWGCMRAADYLLRLDSVNPKYIALTGHSRAGKTALWAGALDERFALVAPHASGAGGASAYRFQNKDAESLALITAPDRFHYWFSPRLTEFSGKEDRLPFDQHFLKALVAPRALLSMEALDDHWANPVGAQYTYLAAQPVFDFLNARGKNGIYFRPGGHDMTDDDWDALLDYADKQFFGKSSRRDFTQLPFPDAEKHFSWTVPAKHK